MTFDLPETGSAVASGQSRVKRNYRVFPRKSTAAMGKGAGAFERLLDKATSQLLLETDWESILQICDLIRQGDTQAKYAVSAIKKKVNDKNPHVALYALEVLESVVKNCGQTVHDEVANKQTMEELKDLIKKQTETSVRDKLLYLIQAWAHAFRNEPKYKVVQDTYQIMKMEGHSFPEFKESDAMFVAERAPDWVDAEECHRCRVQFGVVTRKHHCRACGQIFCGKCSSKNSTIPKFGIEREVRVCEPCFELLNKKGEGKAPPGGSADLPPEYLTSPLSQQSQMPPKKDEAALQEEEELQLAIALSQSEADEKERMRQKTSYSVYPKADPTPVASSAPPVSTLYSSPLNSSAPSAEDVDPELARYLNRTYWEKKQEEVRKSPTPSAPAPVPLAEPMPEPVYMLLNTACVSWTASLLDPQQQYQNGESEENHEQFLKALQNAVTTFLNRMKSNHMRGRSITNDSAVLSLFQSINNMHPQLLELLNQLDEKRLYYEGLQDKLAQVRDARAALNALREEHREKLRRAAEEAERQRQIQLAQKLEIMRQKKQEYLEMQRQLAIQRLQEQEKERQLRLEQQKQTIQMRAQMPAFPLPYAQVGIASTCRVTPGLHGSFCKNVGNLSHFETPPHSMMCADAVAAPQCGGWGGLPSRGPSQLPRHVQPIGPGWSRRRRPLPGHSAVSQAQSLPPMSQAPPTNGMGYLGPQGVPMGYQPYNMQVSAASCIDTSNTCRQCSQRALHARTHMHTQSDHTGLGSLLTTCPSLPHPSQNMMATLPGQDPNLPPQQPYLPPQQPMYQQVCEPPSLPPSLSSLRYCCQSA
uniref:Hepatocyte growth factor-regulated tyrosine kinase substrate n=1 Tax=Scleropages formosus TaxID=113540 RepID=A0A8C9VSM0_SCLFO